MKNRAWKIFFAVSLLFGLGSCGASTVVYDDLVHSYRTCADGWPSPSIGIQGACSHHGGVVTRTIDKRTASQKLLTYGLVIFGTLALINAFISYNTQAKTSVLLGMLFSLILVVAVIAIIDDILVRKSSRDALAQATVKAVQSIDAQTSTPTPMDYRASNGTPEPTKNPIDDLLESLPSPTPKTSREDESPSPTPSFTPTQFPTIVQVPSPTAMATPRLPSRYVSLIDAYDTLYPKDNQSEDTRRYRFHIEQDTRVKGSFSAHGNIRVKITAAGIDPPYSSGDDISFDTIDVFLYAGSYELVVSGHQVVGFSVRLTAYYPQ